MSIQKELLSFKKHTKWSWEEMSLEFYISTGRKGPSHTTLFRIAKGKTNPNLANERYVRKAIQQIKAAEKLTAKI